MICEFINITRFDKPTPSKPLIVRRYERLGQGLLIVNAIRKPAIARHHVLRRGLGCGRSATVIALNLLLANALADTEATGLSSTQQERLNALPAGSALLLGEQHDAHEHQQLQRKVVQQLAQEGRLGALLLEMADQGLSTGALPPGASEEEVRRALDWPAGWPWEAYGPVVMAAATAAVPVWGANLPRSDMRAAMRDTTLDGALAPAVRERLGQLIEEGHCHLLPADQIGGMVRIQVARDRSMATTLSEAMQRTPDKIVVLVAGHQHTRRDHGIPVHLPASAALHVTIMQAMSAPGPTPSELGLDPQRDSIWLTTPFESEDHCAQLRQQLMPRPGQP